MYVVSYIVWPGFGGTGGCVLTCLLDLLLDEDLQQLKAEASMLENGQKGYSQLINLAARAYGAHSSNEGHVFRQQLQHLSEWGYRFRLGDLDKPLAVRRTSH